MDSIQKHFPVQSKGHLIIDNIFKSHGLNLGIRFGQVCPEIFRDIESKCCVSDELGEYRH